MDGVASESTYLYTDATHLILFGHAARKLFSYGSKEQFLPNHVLSDRHSITPTALLYSTTIIDTYSVFFIDFKSPKSSINVIQILPYNGNGTLTHHLAM